jgi:hypothetical protein
MRKKLNRIRNRSILAFMVTTGISLLIIELCTADAPHPPPIFVDLFLSAILGGFGSLIYLFYEQQREFAREREDLMRINEIVERLQR